MVGPEIGDHARYLLVNVSHALIRWYDPESGTGECRELDELLLHLDVDARRNLRLARWYWHDPAFNGVGIREVKSPDRVLSVYAD